MMLDIQELHKTFGSNQVLKGITTTIEQGEVVVVIGPSGSGKSTFLRCLNLLEVPTSGKIFLKEPILPIQRMICIKCGKKWAWFFKISIFFRI